MSVPFQDRDKPWPLRQLRERLCSGDILARLCGPKAEAKTHDIREISLEALMAALMAEHFGGPRITLRKPIARTLAVRDAPFPGQAIPDIVVNLDGAFHICELKSSRTDYNRFDNVFVSRAFKEYLASIGDDCSIPWEVEQDLIKLRLFHGLSDRVRSCLFLMVDAYSGSGRSWADVFADPVAFRSTMRTELVRGWASALLDATTIEPILSGSISEKLIVCEVRPTTG